MSNGRSPFHAGEKEVQARCHVSEEAEELGRYMLQPVMSEQHIKFFQSLEIVYIASEESMVEVGPARLWASVMTGGSGLLRCLNNNKLTFDSSAVLSSDPLNVKAGSRIGILGLELHSRRRNRLNGVVEAGNSSVVSIRVQQAFGNCPKYIQTRRLAFTKKPAKIDPLPVATTGEFGELRPEHVKMIATADTFFLATSAGESNSSGNSKGCDMSHRGGPAGFVVVTHDSEHACHRLKWADYSGNNMFNSLGNIVSNPQVGLLFIDFTTGSTLQLTGTARIDFDDTSLPGANRVVHFTTQAWRHTQHAVPLQAPAPVLEASPYNPVSDEHSAGSGTLVKCVSISDECHAVKTFEFSVPPSLQETLLVNPVLPGQYAGFDFDTSEGPRIHRTWTISCDSQFIQQHQRFTVTIKKTGAVSSFMHDHLQVGQVLRLKGIGGDFSPDFPQLRAWGVRSVLLLAAGIGITPIKAMLSAFVAQNVDVTLLYSVRDLQEAAFLEEMCSILAPKQGEQALHKLSITTTSAANAQAKGSVCVAATSGKNVAHKYTLLTGRVDAAMILRVAPRFMEMCVYMCGPVPFMEHISRTMQEELRFPHMARIITESFNF